MQELRLLNSDEHANFLQRKGEDPANFRPDICHQALLAILDSPLNKAGKIRVSASWSRHVETAHRACQAAWPTPRITAADPYMHQPNSCATICPAQTSLNVCC